MRISPRYRGYLLKFTSCPVDEPWIPRSGRLTSDIERAVMCKRKKREKKERKKNARTSALARFARPLQHYVEDGRDSNRARSDVPFTYPARILSSILPSRAHLLRFHADRFALTRVPFAADGVLHHANVHLLQHVRSVIWKTTRHLQCVPRFCRWARVDFLETGYSDTLDGLNLSLWTQSRCNDALQILSSTRVTWVGVSLKLNRENFRFPWIRKSQRNRKEQLALIRSVWFDFDLVIGLHPSTMEAKE